MHACMRCVAVLLSLEGEPKANTPVCRGWQGNEAQPEQHAHTRGHGAGGPTLAHARAEGGVDWQLSLLQDTLFFRLRAPQLAVGERDLTWASTERLNQASTGDFTAVHTCISQATQGVTVLGMWRPSSLWNELIYWASNSLVRMLVPIFFHWECPGQSAHPSWFTCLRRSKQPSNRAVDCRLWSCQTSSWRGRRRCRTTYRCSSRWGQATSPRQRGC